MLIPGRARVVVADDHTLFAQAVANLLEKHCDVMGIASTGRELLAILERGTPDLVIVDISMPELNGLDAIRIIRQRWPDLPIVVLSMHADVQYAHAALSLGARGYVSKRAAVSILHECIRTVLSGRVYIPPEMSERVSELLSSADSEILTPRQREVLQLVAEGRSAKEIAHRMNISVKTVEFHKSCLVQKLGLRTTAELTKYAIEHGLTTASA
jgi:DNA-binding NarL/FixJ family response regulator